MSGTIHLGDRPVGAGWPTYVIAEIGINHNGSLDLAERLIDAAADAGADAVKFQKRVPELATPPGWRDVPRETPWGLMSYLDYRRRIELGQDDYRQIDAMSRRRGVRWFASPWDIPSVDFLEPFEPIAYKIASALLTDHDLLARLRRTGRPIILATGMSTLEQIDAAVEQLDPSRLLLAHSTSSYPCLPEELNLRMIGTLAERYGCPVGYSGHEVGLQTTVAAVALGACFIERHLTLDRAMWGSDQAASVEPHGFARLVRDIRVVERAMGDGIKRIYASEMEAMRRLRRDDQSGAGDSTAPET